MPLRKGNNKGNIYPKEVGTAIAKGLSLEEAQKAVTMEAYKGLKWSDLLVPNINAIYKEMTAEKNNSAPSVLDRL